MLDSAGVRFKRNRFAKEKVEKSDYQIGTGKIGQEDDIKISAIVRLNLFHNIFIKYL